MNTPQTFLILYANKNAFSYLTILIKLNVAKWSSSVSPQNPEIISVDNETPGMNPRILSANSK